MATLNNENTYVLTIQEGETYDDRKPVIMTVNSKGFTHLSNLFSALCATGSSFVANNAKYAYRIVDTNASKNRNLVKEGTLSADEKTAIETLASNMDPITYEVTYVRTITKKINALSEEEALALAKQYDDNVAEIPESNLTPVQTGIKDVRDKFDATSSVIEVNPMKA